MLFRFQTVKYYNLYFFLITVTLFSCRKKVVETVYVPTIVYPAQNLDRWQLAEGLDYRIKNAKYCYSNGEYLFVDGLDEGAIIDTSFKAQKFAKGVLGSDGLYNVAPANNNLWVQVSTKKDYAIDFYKWTGGNRNFMESFQTTIADTSITSFFYNYNRGMVYFESMYLVSPDNHFLFKIADKSSEGGTFLLVQLDSKYQVKTWKKIDIGGLTIFRDATPQCYHNGKFYITSTSSNPFVKTVNTIDTLGNVTNIETDLNLFRSVSIGDTLIGYDGYYNLIFSFDDGKSWTYSTATTHSNFFGKVNDKILYSFDDYIVELNIDSGNIKGAYINNKGLEGNVITWITKFRDRYYATTKSGVFYINEKYFVKK